MEPQDFRRKVNMALEPLVIDLQSKNVRTHGQNFT